jgi:hypothetical protein
MTPEARAARERKQKIFVAVGGVFLLVLLAIQLPKLLGGSGGSEVAAPATATTAAPVVTPPAGSGATVPVSLPASTASRTAKLTSFGLFKLKDPFVQQVTASTAPAEGGTGSASTAARSVAKDAKKPPETATKCTLVQRATAAPALTIVSVNGQRQALEPGGTFPSADPVFVLVAEHPGSKSVEIGVVGGAYSGGSKTTKLAVGKPLTLVNTATGARYRVVLVAAGSGSTSKPAPPK